eukprot:EG_transcript_13311
MAKLMVKKLSEFATLPTRGSAYAAGYDLSSAHDVIVPARGKAIVPTDLAIAIPEGTYARIAPRSGLAAKHHIDIGAGVVDYDYRGNVGVVMFNHAEKDFEVKRGDRVAQLILECIMTAEVQETTELPPTERGAGGFGSTGVAALASGAADAGPAKRPRVLPAEALVWVDLEMTGLDVSTEVIMEMACVITDKDLNVIAEAPNLIIHVDEDRLAAMGPWCKEHHGQSGLTEACRRSTVSLADAEALMLEFLKAHVPQGKCPLAGNSIHADRKFLEKYMPRFVAHLHYRIVDVSTLKELSRRWYPSQLAAAPAKKGAHRAVDDIHESIAELQYYRRAIMK